MKRKVICYQLEFEKYLVNISTECSSRHQVKSENCEQMLLFNSHALLRIHIIGGQRSVGLEPCVDVCIPDVNTLREPNRCVVLQGFECDRNTAHGICLISTWVCHIYM